MKYTRFAGLTLMALLMGSWSIPAHAQTAQPCGSANCWFQIDEARDAGYQSALHNGPYYYGQSGSPYGYSAYNAQYSTYPSYGYSTPSYGYSTPQYSQYPYPSSFIGSPPSYSAPSSYNYQYQYAYQYQQQYPNPQPTYAYATQPPYQQQYAYPQNDQILRTYWKHGCLYTVRLINGVRRTTRDCNNLH